MNEALETAYTFFTEQGYNGSIEEFVKLINTNTDALDLSYTLFTEEGYAGSLDDFSGLMGVKKKVETDTVFPLEIGTSQPSALSRNQRLNVGAGPEKDTAIERAFGKNEVTDFFGDIYRAWKTGAGQGATVDDAIKVFASGSNVSDKNLQQYIDAVQNMESFAPSEEMQDFSRIYEAEGKGIKGFIKGIAKNPTAAIQVATSSLRAMLNPASIGAGAAGAGAGALAGPAGAGAGAILGMTGALETGLSFTEFLKEELNEKSLDFTDDNIRTILEDDEAMGNITRRSLARGATISTISALTGGLAAGVGANVGRNVALKLGTQAGRAASGVAGLGVQAVGGGAGEAIGRAAAGQEMDVAEIGFEAIGEIASPSLIGTVTAVAKVPKYKVNTEEVSEDFVKDIIGKSKNYLELDNIDIEIIDNPVLEAEVQKRKKELLDIENYKKGMTPQQLANATEEDIIELVSLQNELTKYNESGNEAGKDNAANKKAQIINKLNALQEPSTEKVDVPEPAPDSETVGEGDTEQQQPSTEAPSEQAETPAQPAEEVETEVETEESEVDIKNKTTEELEILQSKIEDSQNPKDENLFGKIDNELENREWRSILYAPLNKINSIVESLSVKEKEKPFGFGSYIEKSDATKVKSIVNKYSNPVSKSQAKKDFKTGLLGNPDTNYSDALLVRESVQSFINSGGTFLELVKSAANEFTSQGFSEEQAAGVIQQKVENIKSKGLAEQVTQEEVIDETTPVKIEGKNYTIENNKVSEIKGSPNTKRNTAKKIIKTGELNVDEGEQSPNPGESTIPRDLATNIQVIQKNIKEATQDIESIGAGLESLFGTKFTPASIRRYFGLSSSELGSGFIQTWVATKEKGGVDLEDGFIDDNGNEFTSDEVAEFIQDNPSKKVFQDKFKGTLREDLVLEKEKFTEVTGLPPTPAIIDAVINAPTQEDIQRRVQDEAEKAAFEEEMSTQQKTKKQQAEEIKQAKKEAVEKERKKTIDNRNRKNALGNINKGKLGTEETTVVLKNIFTIQPKIIRAAIKEGVLPAEILTRYNELAKLIGQRKAVLRDLPEVREIKKKADALYNELIDGINKEIEEAGEAEVEEVDVEKLKSDILSMPVKINTGLDKASRDIAGKIKRLSDEDLDLLIEETEEGDSDIRRLKQLELVKKNINAGFVPAAANDLVNIVETRKDLKALNPKAKGIRIDGLQSGLRKAVFEMRKAIGATSSGNFFEAVFKGNPKTVFDDLLGNPNDTTIFEKLIRPLASGFSQYDVQRNLVLKGVIEKVEKLIAFDGSKIERGQNDIVKDKMKIMTYLLQLEHESNPIETNADTNLTPSANSFIEATKEFYQANKPIEADVTLNMLEDIQNNYVEDGEINLTKLYNSFTPNMKKAVAKYREAFDDLAPKTNFVSAVLRRNKVNLFNNYVKHPVLYNRKKGEEVYLKNQKKFVQASTKSGTIEERTVGAKPLSFDPSYALMKATDDILLDFNMTNEIRKFRMKINSLKNNPELNAFQKQAINAIEESMDTALRTTFESINSDPSATESLINFIRRVGYEATLVSAPRAFSELASNFLFAISANPEAVMDGINNYRDVASNSETMLNFLNRVKSTEATKLANVDELTGKFTDDQGIEKYTRGAGKATGQIRNVVAQILNYGPKQLRNFTADLSNRILSYPDQMIGRPLYLGEFVKVFEQETGIKLSQDEIQKIADGESKYLSLQYADDINKAAIAADKQAIMSTTSRNPILAIEKFKRNRKAGAFRQIFNEANAFMANFFAFEYTTARTAINALLNDGKITNKQATGLLAGITLRMSMYTIIYQVITDNIDQAFRDKDEDDIDDPQEILDLTKRSLTGSILTLLTRQTMGNVPFAGIAFGLELFNEEFLQPLRSDEEYNPYKHSIVYSQLGKKDLVSQDLLSNLSNIFAGPYQPILRSSERAYDLTQRAITRKTEASRKDAVDELTTRMAGELAGNAGLLPFYKDIRRIYVKDLFNKKYGNQSGTMSKSELRKLNPKLYKKLYGPGSAEARLRALKRKLKPN